MPRTRPDPVRPFRLDFTPLARLRRWHNITQGDLAAAVGVSRWTIWRTETDGGNPGVELLVALARALGTPIHDLFEVVDE